MQVNMNSSTDKNNLRSNIAFGMIIKPETNTLVSVADKLEGLVSPKHFTTFVDTFKRHVDDIQQIKVGGEHPVIELFLELLVPNRSCHTIGSKVKLGVKSNHFGIETSVSSVYDNGKDRLKGRQLAEGLFSDIEQLGRKLNRLKPANDLQNDINNHGIKK